MKAFVVMMNFYGQIVGISGPFPWSMKQCESQVELWVKLYLAEPEFGLRRGAVTYQCIVPEDKVRG